MSRLTASRAALDLIASFEGFRARAAKTPDGRWTLGFGHVKTAREGLSVSRSEAEDLLRWDLRSIEDAVRQSALMPLSQNEFDALVSFAFNIGLANFAKSDVLRYLNQGQPVAAALAMHAWRRAKVNGRIIVIDALVRRRAVEAAMFLEPVGPRPAAPSSVVRPQIDYSAGLMAQPPEQRPVEARPVPPAPVSQNPASVPTSDQTTEIPLAEPTRAMTQAEAIVAPVLRESSTQPSQTLLGGANDDVADMKLWPFEQDEPEPNEDDDNGSDDLSEHAPSKTLALALLVLGIAIMGGGIWYGVSVKAISLQPFGVVQGMPATVALIAAAIGLVTFVTSALSLGRSRDTGDEASLLQ
jgi:GH24 family phage-related lysozyme (muramidase)